MAAPSIYEIGRSLFGPAVLADGDGAGRHRNRVVEVEVGHQKKEGLGFGEEKRSERKSKGEKK